jgi:hypothetical protein
VEASISHDASSTIFFASTSESRGQMRVSRAAFAQAPERTFTYAPGLSSATVSPPPPFEGTATFQRNPDHSTSWKGNLRVSLPGAPRLPLTGPKFAAGLSRPEPGQASICVATGFSRG